MDGVCSQLSRFQAKRKEKKHKKEKKDKERKKDKEKEKDGNNEKQRDKKERKGKHKDRKEKHRDNKKKEKSSISEESTVAAKIEDKSGEKLPPKVHNNDRSSTLNEEKCFALFQGQNGKRPSQSTLPALVNDESKFIRELDRRIRDEEKGTGSQLPEKVDKNHQEKVDNKNKKIERKIDPQFGNENGGTMIVENLTPLMKSKAGVITKSVDEQSGWRLEDKEKYKQKDRDKEKEKKKDEKVITTESKKSNQKGDGRNGFGGFTGNNSTNLLKDTNCTASNEAHIRKRKDMCTNG